MESEVVKEIFESSRAVEAWEECMNIERMMNRIFLICAFLTTDSYPLSVISAHHFFFDMAEIFGLT